MLNNKETLKAALPWYDSLWLQGYMAAKAFLSQDCPEKLASFDEMLSRFRTPSNFCVQHLKNIFSEASREQLRSLCTRLPAARLESHEMRSFGRWIFHNHPLLSSLQHEALPLVQECVGEEIEASYNFLSLYRECGVCDVHLDSPEAKWTLDLCIEQSSPWPISFSKIISWPESWPYGSDWKEAIRHDARIPFEQYILEPGEALVFSGSSQWHYRDAIPKLVTPSFCHLAFFHFVPKGMKPYGDIWNWPHLFGIPKLQAVLQEAFSRWNTQEK